MPKDKIATFHVSVLPTDEPLEQDQLDEFNRELYQELKDSNADEVKLIPAGAAPRGAKGAEGLVAEIGVAVLAYYIPEIIERIRLWVKRNPERKVKITSKASGKEIKVVISSADLDTKDVDKIVHSITASFG